MSTHARSSGCLIGGLAALIVLLAGAFALRRWRRMPLAGERVKLLDVPIDPITMDDALARIESFIRARRPHHIFTADASGVMRAHENPELLDIIRRADLVTPDGASLLLATRMRGMRLPERVSGCDMVERLCALAARKNYRIYLLGSTHEVIHAAAGVLATRYPGLHIAGLRDGFFTPEEEPAVVRDIATAHPDILFVALGIPKQEQFIRAHFVELDVPAMLGVGGSFDVISGKLRRAPRWMRKAGLEWLFRLAQQPKRLPRMTALPRFIVAAWKTRKESDG